MHFTTVKGILSADGGMNLYRGCQHNCIYCDSRSRCYQINHDFEDIEVKENALILLEQALSKKRKKCMISTGGMTDPYIPLERKLLYTRRALEMILRHGFGVSVQTKSDLILRDIDLISKINAQAKAVVNITLTTFDDALARKIEPDVSPTSNRIEVLKAFRREGVPTIVWLSPILPFINDTRENIEGIVSACHDAGVYGIICFGMGLTLREGNREYFYRQLDRLFPGLKEKYARTYASMYECPSPDSASLMKLFHGLCEKYSIRTGNDQLFSFMHEFPSPGEQISMWE